MSSLYAQYVNEREGSRLIEEPWGFVEFKSEPPFMRIEAVFTLPQYRRTKRAWDLCDRVVEVAREEGLTHLWTQVWVNYQGANESLSACLAYGFRVQIAEGGRIILTKEITEAANG